MPYFTSTLKTVVSNLRFPLSPSLCHFCFNQFQKIDSIQGNKDIPHFTIDGEKIKYLGVNLIKWAKDLYRKKV